MSTDTPSISSTAFTIFYKEKQAEMNKKFGTTNYDIHTRTFSTIMTPDREKVMKKELETLWNSLSSEEKTPYYKLAKEKTFDYTKFMPQNYIPWNGIIRTMYEDYPVSEIPENIQEYRMRLMPLEEAVTVKDLFRALEEAKFTKGEIDAIASSTLDWICAAKKRCYPKDPAHYHLFENLKDKNEMLFALRFFNDFTKKDTYEASFLQRFVIQAIQYDRKLFETLYECYGSTDSGTTLLDYDCIPHFIHKNDIETVQYLLQFKFDIESLFQHVIKISPTPEMWEVLLTIQLSENNVSEIIKYSRTLYEQINPDLAANLTIFLRHVKRDEKYCKLLSRFLNTELTFEGYGIRNNIAKNIILRDHEFYFDFSELHCFSMFADGPLHVIKDNKKYEIRMVEKTE